MKYLVASMIVLASAPALAYQLKQTPSGQHVRWQGAVKVEVALDGGPLPEAVARGAVERAAATWNHALPPGAGQLTVVGLAGAAATNPADQRNTVRWTTSGWDADYGAELIAITELSYGSSSGRIYDADILLNAADFGFTTSDAACTTAYDLESVLAHELGHMLGMAHENGDPSATMYASVAPCEAEKRDLADDDRDGVRALYDEAAAPIVTPAAQPTTTPAPAPLAPKTYVPADDAGAPISQSPFGCSVASTQRGHGGLVAVLLVLAAVLLARRRFGLAAALGLALTSSAAQASTVHGLTLAELGHRADVVAQGTVVASHSVRIGDRIYTDVELQLAALWKGRAGARITVRQLGGELGGVTQAIEGQPVLAVGDEVVLFVRAHRDGAFRMVGLAQGAFRLVRAAGVSYAVRDESGLMLAGPHGLRAGGLQIYALATLAYLSASP